MPLYAGFDIGIKNLAFCIIDSAIWNQFKNGIGTDSGIKLWKNLNILGESEKCSGTIKSGAKKGMTCDKLASWCIKDTFFCGTHKNIDCKKYKPPKIKNTNMKLLKQKAFEELDKIELFNSIDHIVIESQPRINQQMKMFATSIESYFIIRQNIDNPDPKLKSIKNSPAKNKLTVYNGPPILANHIKDPYARRKYLAEKYTEYFLEKCPEILEEYYISCKKKDDLADAFLHCILACK